MYTQVGRIEARICEWIASLVDLDRWQIDVHKPLAYYGVDSIEAANLSAAAESWLGRPIPLELVEESASAREIAARLAGRT